VGKKMDRKTCCVAVLLLVALSGCQSLGKKQATPPPMKKMKTVLVAGIEQNTGIDNAEKNLPPSIQTALLPKFIAGRTDVPADVRKRFDVSADQVPAKAFFLSLVKNTGLNVVVHPAVQGNISLQLENVSIQEALETVSDVYGYNYQFTKQGIQIFAPGLQTRTFKVDYLNMNRGGFSNTRVSSGGLNSSDDESASTTEGDQSALHSSITTTSTTDFWSELQVAVRLIIGDAKGRKVVISPLAGLVVVQAMPDELRKVQTFLDNAQASLNRQVILEAKVLEVTLNDGFQSGINWSLLNSSWRVGQVGSGVLGSGDTFPSVVGGVGSTKGGVTLTPGKGLSSLGSAGTISNVYGGVFSFALNVKRLAGFIELLSTQGEVQVLSSPRISTMNNQKALIKIGTDEFFVTNIKSSRVVSSTAALSVPAIPDITFESFFSGIALDVTPQISSDGYVTLHVHPTISTVTEKLKTLKVLQVEQQFPLASSAVRETDSIVRAKDGQLIVIGGLMQDRKQELVTGVPLLKDIPGFGALFRHKRVQTKKSELVILIRPTIVKPTTWTTVLEENASRMDEMLGEAIKEEKNLNDYFQSLTK